MSTQVPTDGSDDDKATIASAIQEITQKAQLLVKDEIELARTEIELKAKSLGRGAAIAAIAGVFVLGALVMILFGLAYLAWYVLPVNDNSYFWGFFLVALILLILAAVAGFVASKLFKKGSPPTPQMAIDEGKRIQQTVNEARAAEVKR